MVAFGIGEILLAALLGIAPVGIPTPPIPQPGLWLVGAMASRAPMLGAALFLGVRAAPPPSVAVPAMPATP
ncbi:MAG: hypothetical protein R3B72_29440 [Polyangiaceae bacterium]